MFPHPLTAPQKQNDPWKWALLVGVFVLSYFMFYTLLLRPATDISIHAAWAAEGNFLHPTTFLRHGAHPMWHGLVAFLLLFGLPLEHAAALVTALCKVAEIWLIHRLFDIALHERLNRLCIALLSFACGAVSALCLPFINPTVYVGAGSPNAWHSCTQLMAQVFMLLCVPYTAWLYERFLTLEPQQGERTLLPWHEPIILGVLLFLSLLAKPTFMQAFLPAACLFFLAAWITHPRNSRYFLQIIVCVLPAVLFMILQYLYYFGIIVPWQSSMVLEISLSKAGDILLRALLMMAFPIFVLLTEQDYERDTFYWLTVLYTIVSIVEFILLGEDGRRSGDGNFGWGMMGAALMLWLLALPRFFRKETRTWSLKRIIGWCLLSWHFASGIYYYIYLILSGTNL